MRRPEGPLCLKASRQRVPEFRSTNSSTTTGGFHTFVPHPSRSRHTRKKMQKHATAAFDSTLRHIPTRETRTPLATLAGSSSHFQAVTARHLFLALSVGLMRILETSGSHFGSHCVRACIRLRGSILHKKPSCRDTWHLGPPMNYTAALRNASGLAFMGVQI